MMAMMRKALTRTAVTDSTTRVKRVSVLASPTCATVRVTREAVRHRVMPKHRESSPQRSGCEG